MNPMARLRGKRNRVRGTMAETIAMRALVALGVRCAHLETGWHVRRVKGKIIGASPMRSVLADIVGVKAGRAILCEVKAEDGPSLSLARFADHQRQNLTEWTQSGAIVLVAWVRISGTDVRGRPRPVSLFPWGVPDLALGKPITEDEAHAHHDRMVQRLMNPKGEAVPKVTPRPFTWMP